jgi:mannose-6-phosphate isomerase-like protein (cupin superfamily)
MQKSTLGTSVTQFDTYPIDNMAHWTPKPWGGYEVLTTGPHYLTKRLIVNPGHGTSLQRHQHRSEYLVVVQGQCTIQIEKLTMVFGMAGQLLIERNTIHRISNGGSELLILIETQLGDHISEDDIVRIADQYGRA